MPRFSLIRRLLNCMLRRNTVNVYYTVTGAVREGVPGNAATCEGEWISLSGPAADPTVDYCETCGALFVYEDATGMAGARRFHTKPGLTLEQACQIWNEYASANDLPRVGHDVEGPGVE